MSCFAMLHCGVICERQVYLPYERPAALMCPREYGQLLLRATWAWVFKRATQLSERKKGQAYPRRLRGYSDPHEAQDLSSPLEPAKGVARYLDLLYYVTVLRRPGEAFQILMKRRDRRDEEVYVISSAFGDAGCGCYTGHRPGYAGGRAGRRERRTQPGLLGHPGGRQLHPVCERPADRQHGQRPDPQPGPAVR